MSTNFRVFVDFDGTISLSDTTDLLLQRFADKAWLAVEESWERGEIGSRECMVRQIDLVRATPAELDAFIDGVALDPHFTAFARLCERLGVPLMVVSDGLDRVVRTALGRAGLDLPVRANRLESLGEDRWRLSFPHASDDCRALSGHCKCRTMASARSFDILIGDGRSDFCGAGQVDMVFAKSKLVAHCREQNLPHTAFHDFSDVPRLLMQCLSAHARTAPAAARDMNEDENHAE
ncbi:MtnX-like HAD-IB family phosphatase [Terrarubrum flagellatum]|uniref:MtnX-like HAD-IB family phosphatase n=1 Tax=Terrirubrum flagellatum TaxID=2895980 RepID=UPI003145328C